MVQEKIESEHGPSASSGLDGLAAHLREHAGEAHDSPALAKKFQLDGEFVSDVVDLLTADANDESPTISDFLHQASLLIRNAVRRTSAVFRSWTSDPIRFVFFTGGFCMIALWSSLIIAGFGSAGYSVVINGIVPFLFVAAMPLHLMCFFRHGRLRFPLYSAGVLALALVPAMTPVFLGVLQRNGDRWGAISASMFLDLSAAVFYAFIGGIAALLGGYFQVRRDDRRDRRLSRQELLERLFRMQARLAQASSEPQGLMRRISVKQRIRRSPLLPVGAFFTGVGFALFVWLITQVASAVVVGNEELSRATRIGIVSVANIFGALGLVCLGYLGGRPVRSIFVVLMALGGSVLVSFVPAFRVGGAPESLSILQIAAVFIIGFLTGAGGMVEERTFSKRRLREDDPAFLLAETVRIQMRLRRSRRAACVMMVDVARSTAMKADSDQFDVEYSFRRYHQMVEVIAGRHRGEVVSTAGDGAVVVFDNPAASLMAAKEIHREIPKFNADVNRLRSPFNLRIGIHCGETDSELHQAPFNELIDVAAHVQAMSPVGGIALTEAAIESLEGERLAEITEIVDGHKVHISLDPVLVG